MTRRATRSLVMMSTWVAMMAGLAMPPIMAPVMGSGLMSTTTLAVAVYFLGSTRLSTTAVSTVRLNTRAESFQRARRMDRNWVKVMGSLQRGARGAQNRLSRT